MAPVYLLVFHPLLDPQVILVQYQLIIQVFHQVIARVHHQAIYQVVYLQQIPVIPPLAFLLRCPVGYLQAVRLKVLLSLPLLHLQGYLLQVQVNLQVAVSTLVVPQLQLPQ